MTRESMIKVLRYKAEHIKTKVTPKFFLEVADVLEQQPCEDCISREQAVDAVADLFEMSEYPHPYPQGKPIRLKDIKEKLKQLPPVTSQPKTGHWEPMWYDGYADGCPVWEAWDCSECGYEHNGLEDTLTNYCPNCGAKMESEES